MITLFFCYPTDKEMTISELDNGVVWWIVAVIAVVPVVLWMFIFCLCNMRTWLFKFRHRPIYKRSRRVVRREVQMPQTNIVMDYLERGRITSQVNRSRELRQSGGGSAGVSRAEYFRR